MRALHQPLAAAALSPALILLVAALFCLPAEHALRYYESTRFFGHESDADVPVTPAMELIAPGGDKPPDLG